MGMLRKKYIVARLDEMLTDAINGSFIESDYNETELSRLESNVGRKGAGGTDGD